MNPNGNPHPGRSVDFLSRLHDGDLGPAERARFEAHRAHCAECRRAAIEYEDALAMFRSARSVPPRADLAARILRKVQSTNRPRTPFPLGFRIDLGWAALLATALLALMITTPMVVRRPESASPPFVFAPPPTPAPAREPDRPATDERSDPAGPTLSRRGPRLADARPDAGRDVAKKRNEAVPPSIGAARPASPGDARVAAQSSRETSAAAPLAEERRAAAVRETGRIGGEGGTVVSPLARAAPVKLTIEPIDGFGPAPALVSRSLPVAAGAGGREFVVLVDSQGGVRRVSAHSPRNERSLDELRAGSDGDDEVAASIAKLQFAPGNRPRRLLVRVE